MKKLLSCILIITVFITLMGVTVYAGNGPMPPQETEWGTFDMAYIVFYNPKGEGYKEVYSESNIKNEMSGAVYDKTTNTLTISNLQTDMALETNLMGEDFKINVEGTNKIPRIAVWGDGYGGSAYFTGNGTLIVNEGKEYDNAINLYAEGSKSIIKFANTVNANLYAKEDVINVQATEATNNAIILENGQSANITKSDYIYTSNKWIKGFVTGLNTSDLMQATKDNAPSKVYGVTESRRFADDEDIEDPNAGTKGYTVYELTEYSGSYYCLDQVPDRFLTEAQFAEQGFSVKLDGESNPLWYNDVYTYWNSFKAHQLKSKANTNEYIIEDGYYDVLGDETIAVVLEKIPGTEDIFICNPVENVSADELEELIINEKVDGLYNYVLKGTSLIYKAGNVPTQTPTHTHTPNEVVTTQTTKATLSADGQILNTIENKCTDCGEVLGGRGETIKIPYPKTIKLSKTSFTYNKNVQKPSVKIIGSDGKEIASSNYDVKYSNKSSKKVGEYKVTITFKGNYEGTQTLKYTIQPKGTTLSKLTAGKKQFTANWKKQTTETTGYEVQYSTDKNFKSGNKKINIKKNKTTSSTVNKLKAKKKYYVRIRTYKTVSGKKIYSDWSKLKNVTTKK